MGHSYNGFGIVIISQANGVEDVNNKLTVNQMAVSRVGSTNEFTITNNSSGARYYKLIAKIP